VGMAAVLEGMAVILEVAILEVAISGVVVSNDRMERLIIPLPQAYGWMDRSHVSIFQMLSVNAVDDSILWRNSAP
jgi:hypothetical protein